VVIDIVHQLLIIHLISQQTDEKTGHKYEGEWKDDKKNGQGTYFFLDGGKLVGEFRKDSPWNITDYDKNGLKYTFYEVL
jgi:hypothetical protein